MTVTIRAKGRELKEANATMVDFIILSNLPAIAPCFWAAKHVIVAPLIIHNP